MPDETIVEVFSSLTELNKFEKKNKLRVIDIDSHKILGQYIVTFVKL